MLTVVIRRNGEDVILGTNGEQTLINALLCYLRSCEFDNDYEQEQETKNLLKHLGASF